MIRKSYNQSPIAIGEVGLDYHYEGYNREAQIRLFEEMLQLAVDNDLPLSFHVREAFDDFFPVVANFPGVRGVVHSFSDNKKNLKRILNETEFYVGVNGMATYSTLPTPPLERILLETDAPFLTPVPFRGIINECAYIRNIAEWLAAKLSISFDVIEEATTQNAEQLFKF
jgi:TatD DNase family protein